MHNSMKMKICGITRDEDAHLAIKLGAFALGFIFYEKSPRYIAPERAQQLIDALPLYQSARLVGVFVNADEEWVRHVAQLTRIDTLQFHGDETPEFCAKFSDYTVWKAFRLETKSQLSELSVYENIPCIEAFLFDAAVKGQYGGTGHGIDRDLLARIPRAKPIIVAGGLNATNARTIWDALHPFALDLSSGVETSPGVKDSDKLIQLFAEKD
ncbi:MAG: phosphoribosylanthranilate isomerase [Chitinophagaceae bacterium]|nr:phosphoribosylanthranilate isomerase [Oligoflexus sp.]